MASPRSKSANAPWTNDELRRSIEVYVLLLRFQVQGGGQRLEATAQALLSAPLARRNDAAIRYRMRNISAVVRELGGPVLQDFSPAESVGRFIRQRIRSLLLDNADFARIIVPGPASLDDERKTALNALQVLRKQIEELEHELTWRGHNGPPDHDNEVPSRTDLRETVADIDIVQNQLESPFTDLGIVAAARSRILAFGLKFAGWVGERATKFIDVAMATAAPIVVAKAAGLLPAVIDVVEAIGQVIAH